jgi:hypothetical protein
MVLIQLLVDNITQLILISVSRLNSHRALAEWKELGRRALAIS